MQTKNVLTASDAEQIFRACKSAAEKTGAFVSIALTDESGNLIRAERLDGAGVKSASIAQMKASTAAFAWAPTKAVGQLIRDNPACNNTPGLLGIAGGFPLMHAGTVVGGIGVSGGSDQTDEQIAQAGVDRFLEIASAGKK